MNWRLTQTPYRHSRLLVPAGAVITRRLVDPHVARSLGEGGFVVKKGPKKS
jgi:hypothetical protein